MNDMRSRIELVWSPGGGCVVSGYIRSRIGRECLSTVVLALDMALLALLAFVTARPRSKGHVWVVVIWRFVHATAALGAASEDFVDQTTHGSCFRRLFELVSALYTVVSSGRSSATPMGSLTKAGATTGKQAQTIPTATSIALQM